MHIVIIRSVVHAPYLLVCAPTPTSPCCTHKLQIEVLISDPVSYSSRLTPLPVMRHEERVGIFQTSVELVISTLYEDEQLTLRANDYHSTALSSLSESSFSKEYLFSNSSLFFISASSSSSAIAAIGRLFLKIHVWRRNDVILQMFLSVNLQVKINIPGKHCDVPLRISG